MEFCWDDRNFDANLDGKFEGNFDGNLMGHLMMDSKEWPYDSFDCLLYNFTNLYNEVLIQVSWLKRHSL